MERRCDCSGVFLWSALVLILILGALFGFVLAAVLLFVLVLILIIHNFTSEF